MITVGSLFTQVLSLVNRNAFGRAVRQWDAEHGAKGFRCWDQVDEYLYCTQPDRSPGSQWMLEKAGIHQYGSRLRDKYVDSVRELTCENTESIKRIKYL